MGIYTIYFSPTSSTEKIVKIIANEFGSFQEIDLSVRDKVWNQSFDENDICVIGVPSFGGRVPTISLERMSNLVGNHAKAILVVSYGNRAYEDTLIELAEYVKEKGFYCVAGIVGIAQHSMMEQFATGRPNKEDQEELINFSRKILDKMKSTSTFDEIQFPGNNTYRKFDGVPLKPKAGKKCTKCGLCAKLCPLGAIPLNEPNKTDTKLCITCMRCVHVCPNQARKLNSVLVKVTAKKMESICNIRKENELFM